jgi:hypothetical protein
MSDAGQGRVGGKADAGQARGLSARVPRPELGEALTDRQKSSISAMLDSLISEVERKLRDSLPAAHGLPAFNVRDAVLGARLLDMAAFLPLFLQRSEEHRLYKMVRFSPGGKVGDLLTRLSRERKDGIGTLAKALRAAEGLRFDAFFDPIVLVADFPEAQARQLVWSVAAALRNRGQGQGLDTASLDAALDAAGRRLMEEHRQAERAGDVALRLAKSLQDRGRLDGAMLREAAEGGEYLFLVAGLSALTAIPLDAAGELLLEPAGSTTLLRAASIKRDEAAAILLAVHAGEAATAAERVESFDRLDGDEAMRTLTSWRMDPSYRLALALLAGGVR